MPACNLCHSDFKCNYDLNRHFNSKRHKEKLNSNNICSGCFKEFSTKFNKSRHEQKCDKVIQNITNIQTQNINNNQNITNNNQNITNNQNININILGSVDDKTAEMLITTFKQLMDKTPYTDCFQKLILNRMDSETHDLMDYIEKFDREVEDAQAKIVEEHNHSCWADMIIKKINENDEEYEEVIEVTPVTCPDRKWNCRHAKSEFKINEDTISEILAKTLLDEDKLIVTHDNDMNGMSDLLFKHEKKLHSDTILLHFLSKSNKQDCFNLSEDFKPASKLKEKYPEFYSRIEARAIDVFQAYNKKVRQSFRRN